MIIFQKTTEKSENSIFINDCIKDKTEELRRLKTVKIETIKIEYNMSSVLYHGRKKAIIPDKKMIPIHNNNLKLMTFQIIFDAWVVSFEI